MTGQEKDGNRTIGIQPEWRASPSKKVSRLKILISSSTWLLLGAPLDIIIQHRLGSEKSSSFFRSIEGTAVNAPVLLLREDLLRES